MLESFWNCNGKGERMNFQLGRTGEYLCIMLLYLNDKANNTLCAWKNRKEWNASVPFSGVLNEIFGRQLLNQYLDEPSICA